MGTIFLVFSDIVYFFLTPSTLLRSLRLDGVTEVPQPLPHLVVVYTPVFGRRVDNFCLVYKFSIALCLLLLLRPLLVAYYNRLVQRIRKIDIRQTFYILFIRKEFLQPRGVGLYFLLLQACFPNRSNFFLQNLHVSFFLFDPWGVWLEGASSCILPGVSLVYLP